MAQRVMVWWQGSSQRTRAAIIGGAATLMLVVVAGAVFVGRGAGAQTSPPILVSTVVPTPSPTPEGPTTPTPTPGPQTIKSLKELKDKFGDPPEANKGRFRIPSIGVDAPVSQRIVGANLDLQFLNPYGPADVTWYDFSVNPAYGGTPGAGGNAIFAGHVDYADPIKHVPNVSYFGPGVFRNIDLVAVGDTIDVTMGGHTTTFSVVWKRHVSEHDDWAEIYESNVPEGDAVTIITCSGEFDPATREYNARTVIRAART